MHIEPTSRLARSAVRQRGGLPLLPNTRLERDHYSLTATTETPSQCSLPTYVSIRNRLYAPSNNPADNWDPVMFFARCFYPPPSASWSSITTATRAAAGHLQRAGHRSPHPVRRASRAQGTLRSSAATSRTCQLRGTGAIGSGGRIRCAVPGCRRDKPAYSPCR